MSTLETGANDLVDDHPGQPSATPTATPVDLPHGTGTPPFTAVLWDLDGTIADSAPGITRSLARMFESFGLPVPSPAELVSYVGPPILDSFRLHGLDRHPGLDAAVDRYREFYRADGELADELFPGVAEIITALHAAGIPQSTATSKPEGAATRILTHFGIADRLDFITGAGGDETRGTKREVVAEALGRLRSIGADLSNVVLVGDRFYDVEGATANGVPTIYTTWGYGRIGEEVDAVAVANTPEQLRTLLGLPAA